VKGKHRPTGEANPFEVCMLLACTVSGTSVLVGIAQPRSVSDALTPVLLKVWAVLMAAGGLSSLMGLFWPGDPFTGVEVKRVGLIAVGSGCLIYGCAATLLGSAGFAVATVNLLLAAACLYRTFQVSKRLRLARSHLTQG
jgi:hypothetical protein